MVRECMWMIMCENKEGDEVELFKLLYKMIV